SPTVIYLIVPLELSGESVPSGFAKIVVTNGSAASNPVTLYAGDTAPGMFTLDQDGIGSAAITHLNGSVVNAASPAQVGETVVLYASGLGSVNPTIPDGTLAPTQPLSHT